MIESCPKKRMLLGITILGILTILVLLIESHWTESTKRPKKSNFVVEQNSTCWEAGHYENVKECEPCTDFEINSKSIGVCIHSYYKEVLRCSNGEIVTRSCDKAVYYDELAFWRFEGCMFAIGILSTVCVVSRKRVLNKRILQRVQRQLANCV
ncbi:protein JTB [Diorhabda sublineata]|uniref:protein JTB n=1 Tax=Diorhabda sublineata TaxID=1163346 RepID=UPI0024E050F7|nr:protein JTB [Diorhabda sublineata]